MSATTTTTRYMIQSLQTMEHLVEHPSGGIRVKTTEDLAIHVRIYCMILPFANVIVLKPFTIVPSPSPSKTTTCVIQGKDGLYIKPGPSDHVRSMFHCSL